MRHISKLQSGMELSRSSSELPADNAPFCCRRRDRRDGKRGDGVLSDGSAGRRDLRCGTHVDAASRAGARSTALPSAPIRRARLRFDGAGTVRFPAPVRLVRRSGILRSGCGTVRLMVGGKIVACTKTAYCGGMEPFGECYRLRLPDTLIKEEFWRQAAWAGTTIAIAHQNRIGS
jgi:hypothetical protein